MIKIVIPFYTDFEYAKPSLRALRYSTVLHTACHIQGVTPAGQRNFGVNDGESQNIFQEMRGEYSHVLFTDSDIAYEPEDIRVLMNADKDIIGLPYARHENPLTYQVGMFGESIGNIVKRFSVEEKGLQKVDFIGAGFLLVKSSAFAKIRYPWFRSGVLEEDGLGTLISEDTGFCINAKACGFDIWCHFDYPVDHRLRCREDFNVDY